MWLCHSENSRAECATILNTIDNFMSSKDSKPLLAIKQDAMSGGFKLTYGRLQIPKEIFYDCLTGDNFPLSFIEEKINHILNVYKKIGEYETIKNELINKNQEKINKLKQFDLTDSILEQIDNIANIDIIQQTNDYIIFNGHSLFSFLLPNDFEYFCQNNLSPDGKPVFVTRGVLISGILNKDAIGSSSGSLIHHIGKDYGNQAACDFLSYYQILINSWLIHHGFTISLEDCIPKNTDLIQSEINKYYLESFAIMKTEKDPELLELRVTEKLNKAVSVGQKLAKESLSPTNNLVSIINSGAKGSYFNVTQVTGTVGQQNVSGERINKTFMGRTLPKYRKEGNLIKSPDTIPMEILNDENIDPLPFMHKLFESRGFVSHSYFQGLNPQEFFFHAAGGREGLIDTACKTATTGYIQRKMIKMVEDLKVTYTNCITNANNTVIEFMYGEDNMDAAKLIKTDNAGFSFIDIKHTTDKLNANIDFN